MVIYGGQMLQYKKGNFLGREGKFWIKCCGFSKVFFFSPQVLGVFIVDFE
jgi:hypothetical protein